MIALPDVNLLLALAWSNHIHHDAAHLWFTRNADAGWATCLWTQSGFLRLSMNPQVVGVEIDCQGALNLLTGLTAHPNHQYAEMAPTLAVSPFDDLVPRITGYRQVSDATLLHLAKVQNLRLITFDRAVAATCPWHENLEVVAT